MRVEQNKKHQSRQTNYQASLSRLVNSLTTPLTYDPLTYYTYKSKYQLASSSNRVHITGLHQPSQNNNLLEEEGNHPKVGTISDGYCQIYVNDGTNDQQPTYLRPELKTLRIN